MPKLREDDEPIMKNNVLPFPALQAAPRDPPKLNILHAIGGFIAIIIALGLLALTLTALLR